MVEAVVEGGRSVGAGARSMGQGGTEHSEAGGMATGSSCPGGVGSQQVHGVTTPLRMWWRRMW